MYQAIKVQIELDAKEMEYTMFNNFCEELYHHVPTAIYDYLNDIQQWDSFAEMMWEQFLKELCAELDK